MTKRKLVVPMWMWIGVGVVIIAGLVMMKPRQQASIGINQVTVSSDTIVAWDFDNDWEIQKGAGWYVIRPLKPSELKGTVAEREARKVMITTIQNGYWTLPDLLKEENTIINDVLSLAPDETKDVKVVVVAQGSIFRGNNEIRDELVAQGKMKVVGAKNDFPGVIRAVIERSGTDMAYSFLIPKDQLKMMKKAENWPIKRIEISPIGGDLRVKLMKIDSVEIKYVTP